MSSAMRTPPGDELVGVTIAGRYRIISRLGAGGMGTAYRAWDEQAGIPVVIKIPKSLFLEDRTFAERFRREIRLLQGLVHPHIVPITDVGEHEGLPFVVMRFLPGGSLSNRRLRDEHGKARPNPPGMLHLWLPAIAEALDHVHAQGVVHRDVKPANIFFDAFWGAHLGDFGIAKIVEESDAFDRDQTLTATHMGIGTQEYMSPEQFTPKAAIDGRADQYALAVTVYEILAGERPFTGGTANLIVEVMTHPAPRLDRTRPELPASLVAAVDRGLTKRPGERFATCGEFAAVVLRDVSPLDGESGLARLLCPNPTCATILKLPTSAAAQKGRCPKCQMEMKVADDLGAMWLLDEARRQEDAASIGSIDIVPDAGGGDGELPRPLLRVPVVAPSAGTTRQRRRWGLRWIGGGGMIVGLVVGTALLQHGCDPDVGTGLLGEYFAGTRLESNARKFQRVDPVLAWNFGQRPIGQGVPRSGFSVRWTGFIRPEKTDDYTFVGSSDGGIRITVGGDRVVDEWRGRRGTYRSSPIRLEAGRMHPILIEYCDWGMGNAYFSLEWQAKGVSRERVPTRCLFPPRRE